MRPRLAIAVVVFVAGCGGGDPEEYTVDGDLTLVSGYGVDLAPPCSGEKYFSDIQAGTGVEVVDEAGKTLGTGRLSEGDPGDPFFSNNQTNMCTFSFSVAGVPEAEFYKVLVGSRESDPYSFEELQANDWKVDLVLDGTDS